MQEEPADDAASARTPVSNTFSLRTTMSRTSCVGALSAAGKTLSTASAAFGKSLASAGADLAGELSAGRLCCLRR